MITFILRDALPDENNAKEPEPPARLTQGYETAQQRQQRWQRYGI
jgi:hypothetical protein